MPQPQGDVQARSAETETRTFVRSFFVKDGKCPLEATTWVPREIPELGNGKKCVVEAPDHWSDRSVVIAATHYLAPADHDSIRSLILRVVETLRVWFGNYEKLTEVIIHPDTYVFRHELTYILLHRIGSFNSPVYYNMGLEEHPLVSGCFINSVEDSMESITDLQKTEARIFKRGAGCGVNWSKLRHSKEKVHKMGNSSGPVAFMSALDHMASKIKSGGRKRRAARMDILNVDHPDIMEFIRVKAEAEKMARALLDAGWSSDMNDPKAIENIVPHQSTNLSVRITHDFMQRALDDEFYHVNNRLDGKSHVTLQAKEVLREIAQAAWECGDPGVQFHDTINDWSLLQDIEVINASNPCAEYVGPDNTSCNLASINVLPPGRGPLTTEEIQHVSRTFILAQEVIVDNARYPTDAITEGAKNYRALGLGWANLGALCMYHGYPYDSPMGRRLVANVVSTTTATAYEQSMDLAKVLGPFHRAEKCQPGIKSVFQKHLQAAQEELWVEGTSEPAACTQWKQLVKRMEEGELPRNSAVTLAMPTGTVGMLMDVDTTGPEPAISLSTTKKLSYGGEVKLLVKCVEPALRKLGYRDEEVAAAMKQIEGEGHLEGIVKEEHLPVFDTAFPSGPSGRTISWEGHLKMLGAMQPHLSMAMSKTINMPHAATVEEIEQAYIQAWNMGVKCVAVFRDDSKASQAVYANRKKEKEESLILWGHRRKLPNTRRSLTHKFDMSGTEIYVTVGLYPDGNPGEVFLVAAKQGSTINGLLDSFSIAVSHALQYGCPVSKLYEKFTGTKFPPQGWGNIGERSSHFTSIVDYLFRWMAHEFPNSFPEADEFGTADPTIPPIMVEDRTADVHRVDVSNGEPCPRCGDMMIPHGGTRCFYCPNCGTSEGGCA